MSDPTTPAESGAPPFHRKRFTRECALRFLYQLDVQNQWSPEDRTFELFWEQVLASPECEDVPWDDLRGIRKRVRRLVDTVATHRAELDEKLSAIADNWDLERMSIVDRNVMCIAAEELAYDAGVPPITAINEAIEIAKLYSDGESGRFINGVLDKFLKQTKRPLTTTSSDS